MPPEELELISDHSGADWKDENTNKTANEPDASGRDYLKQSRSRSLDSNDVSSSFASSSRLPQTWWEIVSQSCNAAMNALNRGHDRLLISVEKAAVVLNSPANDGREFQSKLPVKIGGITSDVVTEITTSLTVSRTHQASFNVQLAIAIDICSVLIAKITSGEACTRGSRVRPGCHIILFFNTPEEVEIAREVLHTDFSKFVSLQVLDPSGPKKRGASDICVLVRPCNISRDPRHIEAVELIHYSNWSHSNIVVMINPELVSLSGNGNLDGCMRSPYFMTDYIETFYLDPAVISSKNGTAALLRCFPRKWETYIQRPAGHRGFRLMGEQIAKPSPEKLICEFIWRTEHSDSSD